MIPRRDKKAVNQNVTSNIEEGCAKQDDISSVETQDKSAIPLARSLSLRAANELSGTTPRCGDLARRH